MTAPRWIDADEIYRRVSPDRARRLLLEALQAGFDPADDPPRADPHVGRGHLLLMTSSVGDAAGVKVLSVAPDNPDRGLPRIQAWYVLMDAETLTPAVLLDGTALTRLRTPGTSMIGIDVLAPAEIDQVVIIGSGPQARAHAEALLEIRKPARAVVFASDGRAGEAAAEITDYGLPAEEVDAAGLPDAVRAAQLIICCTSAKDPVLESDWVADGACVLAMGSHEPDRRELPSELLVRSQVVVEDVATALREPGDVVIPVGEGVLDPASLRTMRQLALGEVTRATDRPNIFKTVGMSWQDLVVAAGAARED